MAQLQTGPFTLKYAGNTIENVSELSFDFSADASEPTTIDGVTYRIPTTTSMSVSLTLLGPEIMLLGQILGIDNVITPAGQKLSTGETVTANAFELKAVQACANNDLNDLEIIGCEQTYRLVDASVSIDSWDVEDNVLINCTVVFTGTPGTHVDPDTGETKRHALFQLYKNGSISGESS